MARSLLLFAEQFPAICCSLFLLGSFNPFFTCCCLFLACVPFSFLPPNCLCFEKPHFAADGTFFLSIPGYLQSPPCSLLPPAPCQAGCRMQRAAILRFPNFPWFSLGSSPPALPWKPTFPSCPNPFAFVQWKIQECRAPSDATSPDPATPAPLGDLRCPGTNRNPLAFPGAKRLPVMVPLTTRCGHEVRHVATTWRGKRPWWPRCGAPLSVRLPLVLG